MLLRILLLEDKLSEDLFVAYHEVLGEGGDVAAYHLAVQLGLNYLLMRPVVLCHCSHWHLALNVLHVL